MFRNAVVAAVLWSLAPAAHAIEIGLSDDVSAALRGQPLALLGGIALPIPIDPQARIQPDAAQTDSLAFDARAPLRASFEPPPAFTTSLPVPLPASADTGVIAPTFDGVWRAPATPVPLAAGLDLGSLSLRTPSLEGYTR